jgi:hypothetical protein
VYTQFRSAKELADLVMEEARKSGKCQNLLSGTVRRIGHPGDWTFSTARQALRYPMIVGMS